MLTKRYVLKFQIHYQNQTKVYCLHCQLSQNTKLSAEEQMISPVPDIKRLTIQPKDEFMILACDGIWNSLTSQQVVDFIRERIQKGEKKMSNICEEVTLDIIQKKIARFKH